MGIMFPPTFQTHPNLTLIWNYWPFSMFFWTPVRMSLNLLFSPINLLLWWIPLLWNLFTETTFFILFVWALSFFNAFWLAFWSIPIDFVEAVVFGLLCITYPTQLVY